MGTDIVAPVHDLLLGLAGRLDDDLLSWVRELLAVGEQGQAVELATAALAAERVVLPPPLRAALVDAARGARTDLDVERALPPPAVENGTPHRFDAAAAPGEGVEAALAALPARRLAGCTVRLTWRCTPAGTAPGPLPHAVVLVEAEPDRSPDVLAYLLATELDRVGTAAAVEVFTAGATLPAYHVAALRGAREVMRRDAAAPPPPPVGRHGTGDTATFSVFAERAPGTDASGPEQAAAAQPSTGRRRRPDPAPGPDPAWPEPEQPPNTDPFSGPLNAPLMPPLLEPTGPGEPEQLEPPRRGGVERPAPAGPVRSDQGLLGQGLLDQDRPDPARPAQAQPPGQGEPARPSPSADPTPAAVPDEWEHEWRSGEWAMPRPQRRSSDRDHPDRPGPARDPSDGPRPDRPRPGRPQSPTDGGTGAFEAADRPGAATDAAGLPRRPDRPAGPGAPGRRNPAPSGSAPSGSAPSGSAPSGPAPFTDRPLDPSSTGRSLFESPTGRVESAPPPRRVAPPPPPTAPPDTGRPATPPERSWPGRPPVAPSAGETRPVSFHDDPLFGPVPDAVLFGDRPPPPRGPADRPEQADPDPSRRERRPEPGEPPSLFPTARTPPTDAGDPVAPSVPEPAGPSNPGPEPAAMLSGTEGDLLAQLQAELAARDRRPRPYRRAAGAGRPVNGHDGRAVNGHDGGSGGGPPDLAG